MDKGQISMPIDHKKISAILNSEIVGQAASGHGQIEGSVPPPLPQWFCPAPEKVLESVQYVSPYNHVSLQSK